MDTALIVVAPLVAFGLVFALVSAFVCLGIRGVLFLDTAFRRRSERREAVV